LKKLQLKKTKLQYIIVLIYHEYIYKLKILMGIHRGRRLSILSLKSIKYSFKNTDIRISPIIAIKFKIMVMFMRLSQVSIAVYLAYRDFFNKRNQLK
jgi:putative ABC transport system permease protein